LTFPFSQQWNARITEPKEVALVQEEISGREEELSALEARLLAEGKKLKSYEATAKALVGKINYSKRRLAAEEGYLVDLLGLKSHLDEAGGSLDESERVSDEIVHHQEEISTLAPKIKEMIQELHARKLIHNASKTSLEGLESHKKHVLDLLSGLKGAFSPIHATPAEIWASVFRFRLEDDTMCYLKASGESNIRHTPLRLAQVCSFWREVIHTERDLWRYFIYSLRRISDPSQAEIWKHFSSLDSGSSILLTSLDEATPYAANTNPAALIPSPTSAHVLIRSCNQSIPATLPFNQALSLTIELDLPATLEFMNGVRSAFPKATGITIICSAHLPRLDTNLSSQRHPEVTSLKMDLTTFDSFWIIHYGHSSFTEELHVRHNGVNQLMRHPGFEYSKLRVLGITPPDNVWIEAVRFPLLQQLVLYGPKIRTVGSPELIKLSQHPDFPQVRELSLLNWPMYTPPNAPSWSIMPLILAIADKLRLVETIRCADSFIEGECLVTLVKLLMDTTANQSPSKLKTVIVDRCSGITQRDCELIAASVEKLVVYV
jgi:hypothetical protein